MRSACSSDEGRCGALPRLGSGASGGTRASGRARPSGAFAPLLWRFHRVHHFDRVLDTTTALRFHGGEVALSLPFQAAQILAFGIRPRALELWQTLLAVSALFHHSNVRIPPRLERALRLLVVTPRMHGIHHSVALEEASSNWSSGLTLWDRLHKTLRLDVPRATLTIGAPGHADEADPALPRLLAMPFRAR